MVFLCPGVNDDIVQVDQGELQIQLSKTILHKVLKRSRCGGILRNSYMPILSTVNAVYWQDSSDILTCQNPLLRSMVEKYLVPTKDSIVSRPLAIGYESFFILAFNRQKSMQNHRVPSFFCTNTMALHQGDCDGLIAPPSHISCTCHRTSSTSCGAIQRNLSLKGSSCTGNNSITCSAASVTPISPSSRQNT